jgi:hypothetical protein
VLHRELDTTNSCLDTYGSNCTALEGSVVVIENVGIANQKEQWLKDANAWHFMRRPPSLAMGANNTFATCGEAHSGNYLSEATTFIGPTLWSSDLNVFAVTPPGGNGSHLDMLHATPYCTGIAHEQGNAYWTFNGEVGSLDRYDFNIDHGPGNSDHSDGEIARYPAGLSRMPGVPSHMVYNSADQHLYVNDTGNARVVKLDTTSGTVMGPIVPQWEPFASSETYQNATVSVVVSPGFLQKPSGMAIHNNTLYIGDYGSGEIHTFTLDGEWQLTFDTGLGRDQLGGITMGPDGKLYFVQISTGDVYRVDP